MMSEFKELIKNGENGINFGDYTLSEKTKQDGFEFQGDLYKVKTFKEITKLEKNGMMVYESVPGTKVEDFKVVENLVSFKVFGAGDTQITLEMEADSEYTVYMDEVNVGDMTTNLSAKLSLSADLANGAVEIEVVRK